MSFKKVTTYFFAVIVVLALGLGLFVPGGAAVAAPEAVAAHELIAFYEGNNGGQNLICVYSTAVPFAARICKNDEARSAVLYEAHAGTIITVFDSPSGATNDDFTIIRVHTSTPAAGHIVGTFQRSYTDAFVTVTYIRNNGLDGKVSYLRITP